MTWQSIHFLNLLWLLPLVAALFVFAAKRRSALLRRLAHPTRHDVFTRFVPQGSRTLSALLTLLALAAMVVALARPAWNKTTQPFQSRGRDVVFLLDISRSMLASHRGTTRLEEAKFAIQECLQSIRGDRVALVIFAGNAKVACPLTHDTAFFLSRLNDVDHRSVSFGGTMLGDAIRLICTSVFKGKSDLYRDVIVITDGEDMQSNPVQAAELLAEYNARLIAVGMGDTTPRPLVIHQPDGTQETITDNGKTVMTRLDVDTLRQMTSATPGGLLIPVPSDTLLNLNDIYSRYIQLQEKKDYGTRTIVTYEEKFPLFALLALLLLLATRLLPLRRVPTVLLALLLCTASNALHAAAEPDGDALVRQATELLAQQQFDQADKLLAQVLSSQPDHPYATFNQGVSLFRQAKHDEALASFQRALQLAQAQQPVNQTLVLQSQLALAETAHTLAQQQQQQPQTLDTAIQNAKLAVDNFQNALHTDPQRPQTPQDLQAAKLHFKTLRQLKKQQQQQQQQQNSSDDKKDDKKDDDQKQDKQQPQDALKDLEQQQRQAADDLNNQQKSNDELQQQQQQLEKQAQDALDKQQDNQFLRQSLAKQQEAKQKLEQNERQQARQAQKEAADLTKLAQKQPPSSDEQPQPQPDQQADSAEPDKNAEPQTPPKAEPLQDARSLDAINLENLNRQKRRENQLNVPARQRQDW